MLNTISSKLSPVPRQLLDMAMAEHRQLDNGADDLDPTRDKVDIHRFYASKDPEQPSRSSSFSSERLQSVVKQNDQSLLLWSKRSGCDGENLSLYLVADEGEKFTYVSAVDYQYGKHGRFLMQKDGKVLEGSLSEEELKGFWRTYSDGV